MNFKKTITGFILSTGLIQLILAHAEDDTFGHHFMMNQWGPWGMWGFGGSFNPLLISIILILLIILIIIIIQKQLQKK